MREDIAALALEALHEPLGARIACMLLLCECSPMSDDDVETLFSVLGPWWAQEKEASQRIALVDLLNAVTWRRSEDHVRVVNMYREMLAKEHFAIGFSVRERLDTWYEKSKTSRKLFWKMDSHRLKDRLLLGSDMVGFLPRLVDDLILSHLMPRDLFVWMDRKVTEPIRCQSLSTKQSSLRQMEALMELDKRTIQLLDKHFTADTIKEGFLRAMRERGKVC